MQNNMAIEQQINYGTIQTVSHLHNCIFYFIHSIYNCVESIQIRSFSWSTFSPNAGKCELEKTPYLDTSRTVYLYSRKLSFC